jgi:Aerotolerance regulator N-terminal
VIGWLNPAALAGLALAAAPVIVHLLRTHRAERIPFPSLRFVRETRTAAIRLRTPSDWILLFVRVAIVAVAVLAVAQPIVLTTARRHAWDARIARAVVLDGSPSVQGDPRTAGAAAEAAQAELSASAIAKRFEGSSLRDSIARAAAWVSVMPPARMEIVVISDFQAATLQADDVGTVPAAIGLRFVRVGDDMNERKARGLTLVGGDNVKARVQALQLSGPSSSVVVTADDSKMEGLQIEAVGERAAGGLLRAVATAGAPAPSAREPLVVQFAGGRERSSNTLKSIGAGSPGWMVATVLRLRDDRSLAAVARATSAADTNRPSEGLTIVATDRSGQPLVQAASLGSGLLLQVAAPADSFAAAVVLRAALMARHGPVAQPELEVARIDSARLDAWTRAPGPLQPDAWRRADRSDARWFWAVALLLVALEHAIRRSAPAAEEGHLAAA